jgi:hypothetical protein
MHINGTIIVEFGLGTTGVINTKLEPTEDAPIGSKTLIGIALESYDKAYPMGEMIGSQEGELTVTQLPIVLIFHNLEGAKILKEHLETAITQLQE